MVWAGGIDSSISLWLLGSAATIFVGLIGIWASSDKGFHSSGPIQAMAMLVYLPCVAALTNQLPASWFASDSPAAIIVLCAALAAAVAIHLSLYFSVRSFFRTRIRRDALAKSGSEVETPDAIRSELVPEKSFASQEPDPSPKVEVYRSVAQYKEAIIAAENDALDLAYVQFRIAPYFKSTAAIRRIAADRFGNGSADFDTYLAEHEDRRAAFFAFLANGGQYREILPRERVLRYVKTGTHADSMWPLPVKEVVSLLKGWADAIDRYPNYLSAVTDESVPLKYHVIDHELVVIHEPVGRGDSIRLNSIFIHDPLVAKNFEEDFELVWSLTDPYWQDPDFVRLWIHDELIPLAEERG